MLYIKDINRHFWRYKAVDYKYIERIMSLQNLKMDYLNFDAVFSDETKQYRKPVVPRKNQRFEIRLRVASDNIDRAFVNYGQSFVAMEKTSNDGMFDYYTAGLVCNGMPMTYYFVIEKNGRQYFYNKQGVVNEVNREFNFMVLPDFETPSWAKGAVMYQIYVDRFFNGDSSNDVKGNEYIYLNTRAKKIDDWNTPVEEFDVCNFYGGDLQGVIDKLDYLCQLGVDAIYFNPIFVSPSNHKYDIQDYDYVDPHYGVIINDGGNVLDENAENNNEATMYIQRTTDKENLEASNRLLIKLIELAHSKGIRVILDGVFNHCGAFNKWLDREGIYERAGYPHGAYNDKDSEYTDYFKWDLTQDKVYDGWWGHSNHPKLNYEESKKLFDYIIGVGVKWVSPPFNADGWRLDVAADLGYSIEFNMKFWREFRRAVKKAKPDAIILAEHYGDPKQWLQGDQWDTVMNYDAFMEPLTWFLTGMEKHSESSQEGKYNNSADFEAAMRYYMARFSFESLSTSMNELSNHDHSRFLTRTNRKVGRVHTAGSNEADSGVNVGIMKEAIVFQLTWIGAPTIYYGDEAGMTGWTDPDNRRTYPWGRENMEIMNFYKAMIKIHKKYKVFGTGSLDFLYMQEGIICFGRWDEHTRVAVVLNNNNQEKKIEIPVWRMNVRNGKLMNKIISSDMEGYSEETEAYVIQNGIISVNVPAFGSGVYLNEVE